MSLTGITKTICIIALASGLIVGVVYASGKYLDNAKTETKTVSKSDCKNITATNHKVQIKNGVVTPANTNGELCDTMTITSLDDPTRYIAFGKHDEHIKYDGVVKEPVESGKSLTVTLNKTGSYLFHDHDDETVGGTFTVTE